MISLTNRDEMATKKHPFPCPCTIRTALTHYLDITSLPKTHLIKELANHAIDAGEREKLLELTQSTEAGRKRYEEFVLDSQRSVLCILEEFQSIQPPIDLMLEILPRQVM